MNIPKSDYYLIVYRDHQSSPIRKEWAKDLKIGNVLTQFTPLKIDGGDKSYHRIVEGQEFFTLPLIALSNSLVVKIHPAKMNLQYGELEIVE